MLEKCKISGFADEIAASFDEQLRVLGDLGQSYLELRGADGIGVDCFTNEKAAELKEKTEKANIRVSAIGSPIGKIGVKDDFVPHFEKFKRIVELAQLFETKYIRMFSFYLPNHEKPEQYRDEVFERIGRLVDYAAKENVVLLHENEKGIFGDTAKPCVELFERFYGEHFQGIFDFANFIQCGQDTMEAYEKLYPYIRYFHVKDAHFADGEVTLPGEGDGQLKEIFSRADAAGFQGFLSLEPHLSNFKGFERLELGTRTEKVGNGELGFRAAHASLLKMLGWK